MKQVYTRINTRMKGSLLEEYNKIKKPELYNEDKDYHHNWGGLNWNDDSELKNSDYIQLYGRLYSIKGNDYLKVFVIEETNGYQNSDEDDSKSIFINYVIEYKYIKEEIRYFKRIAKRYMKNRKDGDSFYNFVSKLKDWSK